MSMNRLSRTCQDRRDFLRTGFRRLRQLRTAGIDLEVPILYKVAATQSRDTSQQFGQIFLALEALRSSHLESLNRTFLVGGSVFRHIADDLRLALTSSLRRTRVRSTRVRRQMSEKILELRRPPFWDGLA